MNPASVAEAGVDALIARLHRDGVEAGKEEADRLVEAAQAEAEALLAAARSERERLKAETEREIEALHRVAEAALGLAMRDTVLRTREALTVLIAERLGARVRAALEEPEQISELIGWAAQRLVDGKGALVAEIGGEGADGHREAVARLTDVLCRELADGAPVLHFVGEQAGVVLRREGETLAVELSDETLTAFLLAQIQPRLRRILEGARLG